MLGMSKKLREVCMKGVVFRSSRAHDSTIAKIVHDASTCPQPDPKHLGFYSTLRHNLPSGHDFHENESAGGVALVLSPCMGTLTA